MFNLKILQNSSIFFFLGLNCAIRRTQNKRLIKTLVRGRKEEEEEGGGGGDFLILQNPIKLIKICSKNTSTG